MLDAFVHLASAVGGFAGATVASAIRMGMARGMLSNEAGLGTAPMAHATAETKHPFQQGIWGAFEVFVDTIIICTITALAILSTGVFFRLMKDYLGGQMEFSTKVVDSSKKYARIAKREKQ